MFTVDYLSKFLTGCSRNSSCGYLQGNSSSIAFEMRSVSVVLILVAAVLAIVTASSHNWKPHYDLNDAPALFEKFIKDYNRHYKDQEDYNRHFYAFIDSLKYINKANSYDDTPGSGVDDINSFADYTEEERKHLFGLLTTPPRHRHQRSVTRS